MIRVKGDALFALVLFAIFSFGTYQSLVMDDPAGGPADVGAAFFPFWVCVFIQVLCVIVFVTSVRKAAREQMDRESDKPLLYKRAALFVSILALLFVYIVSMDTVGFVVSSAAFLILVHQVLVFTETGRPSPPKGLLFSVVFFATVSGALYYLFNTVFRLALP